MVNTVTPDLHVRKQFQQVSAPERKWKNRDLNLGVGDLIASTSQVSATSYCMMLLFFLGR